MARPPRWSAWWGTTFAAGIAIGIAAAWEPQSIPVLCLFRRTVGLPCPSCGLTRAFLSLARGELGTAFAFHPFAPLLALEAAFLWLLWGWRAHRRAGLAVPATLDRIALAHLALFVALWVGRLASGTLPY
jgi:hypothetical protein